MYIGLYKNYATYKKHVVISLTCSIIFLFIGVSIYLLCRLMPPILIKVCSFFNILDYINCLRITTIGQISNQFILYSLPDLMWSCASLAFLYGLTVGLQTKYRIVWSIPLFIASVGTEVAQGLKLLPGTFDWIDLFCYFFTFMAYYLIIYYYYDKIRFT